MDSANCRISALARRFGESLAGEATISQRQKMLLRRLRRRIERRVAKQPSEEEAWKAVLDDPLRRISSLEDLLSRSIAEDAVARHFAELLVPPETIVPRDIELRNFTLAIEAPSGDSATPERWVARLLGAPCRQARPTRIDLSSALAAWGIFEGESREEGRRRDAYRPSASEPQIRDDGPLEERLGMELFEALFTGEIRDAWMASTGLLEARDDLGLRLQLVFDLSRESGRCAAALPWELLRDPLGASALSKSCRTPVVRALESGATTRGSSPPGLHRILSIHSGPFDQMPLDLETERRDVEYAWRAIPEVRVEHGTADLDELRRILRDRPFEILHFAGHGDFDAGSGEGCLIFEGPAGNSLSVSASVLVDQLVDGPLGLVVLSACRSGEISPDPRADPFAGVATALVRAGVPAVVAMREPVMDNSAIIFVRELHRYLAAGDSVETAVTEGRLAVARSGAHQREWSVPVLYERRGGIGRG